MKISHSIDIKSTPEVVFGWLENPEKAVVWMSSVSKTEILHETPDRVGTTFREIVEDEGGSVEMQGVITGFELDQFISFHLVSKVNTVDVTYWVEASPQGARLAEEADVRWKFPVNILSIFIGDKIRRNITDQIHSEFNRLKELCE